MAPASYWSGIKIIPFIALAYYFNFLYSFPANYEFFCEKTVFISIGTLCAAIINIVLNFLLIPSYGILGAAIATLIGYVFSFLFHDIIARFIVKNFEYSFMFYLKGLLPLLMVIVFYYFTIDLWLVRWVLASFLGFWIILRMIKLKKIF